MKRGKSKNGMVRGRLPDGTANPVDLHVGKQLKESRLRNGLTQEQLAMKMGITFQQIQKYEKGWNRIGASRLWDLAQVLHEPINYFYDGMKPEAVEQSPRKINGLEDSDAIRGKEKIILTPSDFTLLRKLRQINDINFRTRLLSMVDSVVRLKKTATKVEKKSPSPKKSAAKKK